MQIDHSCFAISAAPAQAQHLADLANLAREVEGYRSEAAAAGASLHAAVERLNARVAGEEAGLERARAEAAHQVTACPLFVQPCVAGLKQH